MLGFLNETILVVGETALTGTHIISLVVVGAVVGWTYLKGFPFLDEDEEELFEHKSLQKLREPEFREIINEYGKDIRRSLYHDKKKIGVVDRELVYRINVDNETENNKDEKNPQTHRKQTLMVGDRLKPTTKDDKSARISLIYVRPDTVIHNLAKKLIGLPQRVYDLMVIPERFLLDADGLTIDKNVNLVKYAGMTTIWCPEVKNLFNAFTNKDVEGLMDENLVNFLRRVTHFDVEQAKQTQFKKFETQMEKLRWGDKAQRDSSKI